MEDRNKRILHLNEAITLQRKLLKEAIKRGDVKAELGHEDMIEKIQKILDDAQGEEI